MEGWIKVHRPILDNPIVTKDSDYFSVWMYLLLMATHNGYETEFKGKIVTLSPGQLITGRKVIADKFHIEESKVKRILLRLEDAHMIDRIRSNKNSLITLINWDSYQKDDQQNDRHSDQQMTTNKNVKNVIKNVYFIKPTPEEIKAYCIEKGFSNVDAESFFDYYDSKGWRVGNSPMKNWRSAVNGWERRSNSNGRKNTEKGYKDRTADVDITPHAYHGLDCN